MRELQEFIELVIDNRGKNPSKYTTNGIPVIDNYLITDSFHPDLTNVNRYISEDTYNSFIRKKTIENDVLITLVGNGYGNVALAPKNSIIIQNTIGLRTNKECNQIYLYYLLLTQKENIRNFNRGCAQPSIKVSDLLSLQVNIPNLATQCHIVDILGTLDEKIENNEQLINILENLAEKKYLDFAIKTSTKTRLEDVIELFDSKRIPLSSREREQRKGIYPYYGATGILDYVNSFLFSGEYVLFAEDGTVTDTNGHPIVQLVNGNFWVNNHAHILKGKNGWHDYTLYVALKQLNVDKAVTGAVQPKINQANLLSLEIPNLSNNNLQTINTELDVVFHKVFHLRAENKSLQELKGLYLKKFFE